MHLAIERLPAAQRYLLAGHLAQFDLFVRQIEEVERQLAQFGVDDPAVQKLLTLPGVDFYSAQVILEEIGDITRFPTRKHLSGYAGLVPRVMQSGNILHKGRIHKQGPRALRWFLTTCAHVAMKAAGKFQRLFHRWEKRLGNGKAIVAAGDRRIKVIFALLAHMSPIPRSERRRPTPRLSGYEAERERCRCETPRRNGSHSTPRLSKY